MLLLRSSWRLLGNGVARRSFSTGVRAFPSFQVWGKDTMFSIQPIAAEYTQCPNPQYLKPKRRGSLMFSWAPNTAKGYDFKSKAYFSMTGTECGLVLEFLDSNASDISFTHAPNMNADSSNAKTLQIARASDSQDQPIVLFQITDGTMQYSGTLNLGETRVVRELLAYSIPRIFGFHHVLEGPPVVENANRRGSNNGPSNTGAGNGGQPVEWPF